MPPLTVPLHPFPPDAAGAHALQRELARQVVLVDQLGPVRLVAGIDVSAGRTGTARAAVVVMRYPELDTVEVTVRARPITFPYVPGLLSFRELPVIFDAWEQIKSAPDLVIVDGQGIAHPRRLGIAAHFGVLTGLPAIGCAKSRLSGRYEEPGPATGDRSPLLWPDGEIIGTVLRSKARSKPLFISPGHRISVTTATTWVEQLLHGYRLPEPTRRAHNAAGQASRDSPH